MTTTAPISSRERLEFLITLLGPKALAELHGPVTAEEATLIGDFFAGLGITPDMSNQQAAEQLQDPYLTLFDRATRGDADAFAQLKASAHGEQVTR